MLAEVTEEATGYFNDLQAWLAHTMTGGMFKTAMHWIEPPAGEAAMFIASHHGARLSARTTGNALLFWQIATLPYAAYVLDPDGINLEVVFRGR
jgi:TetR/AcrR family transcriptional regulator, transcriptional repressor for nem operon